MTSKTVLYVDHDLSRVEWFNQQVKPELDVETAFNGWDGHHVSPRSRGIQPWNISHDWTGSDSINTE